MSATSEFDIQRELLTIEEKLVAVRQSFSNFAASDETRELRDFDSAIKKVRGLQVKMRKWFAP